jgi:hypothetical protein
MKLMKIGVTRRSASFVRAYESFIANHAILAATEQLGVAAASGAARGESRARHRKAPAL